MPFPNYESIDKEREFELLQNGLRTQLELAMKSGKALVEEHREKVAYSLLSGGVHLIPSDYLTDNQFVVSRGVYEAAKRLCSEDRTGVRR